jgi:hypothetical protein
MQNDPADSKRNASRHEIVFKRESYFSEVAAHFIALLVIVVVFIYFFDSGFVIYVIGLIAAVVWTVSVIRLWRDYGISIIVDEDGITETYLTGDSLRFEWREISQWYALLDGDHDYEIRFTITGSEPKTHTLPVYKIGNNHYPQLKDIFIEHCGKPAKIDARTLADQPNDE